MSGGLFVSARRLLGTVLELGQVRLELFVTEFELEKQRVFDTLLVAVAALFGLGVGVVLLCIWLVLLAGEAYRLHALAGLAVLFLAAGTWGLLHARGRMQNAAPPFGASVAELMRDRAALLPPEPEPSALRRAGDA